MNSFDSSLLSKVGVVVLQQKSRLYLWYDPSPGITQQWKLWSPDGTSKEVFHFYQKVHESESFIKVP